MNPCPPSLAKALHPSNPDREVWLALRRSGRIGKALPSMCVLVIKHDKDGNPVRAKSRIVVLGNHEDRVYDKSQKYAPVLKYSSLRLLVAKAVRAKRVRGPTPCRGSWLCQRRILVPEENFIWPTEIPAPLVQHDHRNSERHWTHRFPP